MTAENFYTTPLDSDKDTLNTLSQAYSKSENGISDGNMFSQAVTIDQRPHYHRLNYEKDRVGDSVPKRDKDIMMSCRDAYEKVGIIRSVVDLMIEIAVEGLRFEHNNPSVQNFYDHWFKRSNMNEKAALFANHYLVEGNVVVRRKVGKINNNTIRQMRRNKAFGQHSLLDIEPGIIPLEYIFYDPAGIALIGDELALFSDKKSYGLELSYPTLSRILSSVNQGNQEFIASLPEEIKALLSNQSVRTRLSSMNGILIPIPDNRVYVAHNKKPDSRIWARSFIYSILSDIIYNEKLRLAKMTALDGWSNSVRLWKIGDHEQKIFPDVGSFNRLANVLRNHTHGTLDILWDSMIEMKDYYPPIEKLDDFNENFDAIMLGLGVPRTLVGGSESAGLTNMFIGLRNMMKRIDGVRRAINSWLHTEIDFINSNLGFRDIPSIKYSMSNLFDQQSYFKLLLDLYDRQMISDVSILEKIGENFDIERFRSKEEHDSREKGALAPRNGPFLQPRIPNINKTVQEDRINLESKNRIKENEKKQPSGVPNDKEGPVNSPNRFRRQNGRPPGSTDKNPRQPKPRTSRAALVVLADRIQSKLDDIVDKSYLVYNKIDNKRQLTSEQKKELAQAKLELLASVDTDEFSSLEDLLAMVNLNMYDTSVFMTKYTELLRSVPKSELNANTSRMLQNQTFAELHSHA